MRRAWRWVARNWPRSLYLASWPPMAVADAFLLTEPKHGANTVPFWVAIGACAAMALGAAAMLWRDYRRLRKEEEALSLDITALNQALIAYGQLSWAGQSLAPCMAPEDRERPTSPLDKSAPAEPRAEPIVGYRIWRAENGHLRPVGMGNAPLWVPGENVAEDFSRDMHWAMPGFWALRSLELANERVQEYPEAEVIGAVELYGRVVEHELGWRAEKARVLAVAGLARSEYEIEVYVRVGRTDDEWVMRERFAGRPDEARERFRKRYPDAALYVPSAAGAWYLRSLHAPGEYGQEVLRHAELTPPFDAAPVGRRYGVPAFSSLEGLQAFAREMGAEE